MADTRQKHCEAGRYYRQTEKGIQRENVCVCVFGGMESKNKEAKKRMWIHVNIITSASLDEHDHSEVALSNVIKKKLRNFETITTLLLLRVISESFLAFSGQFEMPSRAAGEKTPLVSQVLIEISRSRSSLSPHMSSRHP